MKLDTIYRERFVASGLERRNQVWRTLCRFFFSRHIAPTDRVLELACGYGEFINNIAASAKFAVDLNPDSRHHVASDVTYHHGPATDLSFVPDESVDVVFTSNFLEHLPSKQACDEVFAAVRRKLRPGGLFLILGPNIRYAHREYWDFYDHFLPLSHLSLAEGLTLAGFTPRLVVPRFLPYTMTGRLPVHETLIRAYLAMPLAWRVLGKQFFVVAERPSADGGTPARSTPAPAASVA
ncbi:class I SAM-dependent methyltransferase [Muricoccus radiodurans]|uniref:class I SAM-dependent methyltransferase n=1 Tax=Muricoccus radiodurans TaxID=2231721 RepID=UPI003CEDA39C